MATILNPNAPLFYPTSPTATAAEQTLISLPWRPPTPYTPPFVSQRYDHSCVSKGAIFFHPSLIYYHSPSLSLFPHFTSHFSCYIPSPKYPPSIIAEVSGALPRLGDELGGVEEQSFPMEVKVGIEEQSLRTVTASRFAIRGMRGRHGCRQFIKRGSLTRGSQLWVRKASSAEDRLPQEVILPSPDDLQFCEKAGRSTVMIKNIPNKFSRRQMLDLLDQHCRIENQKIQEEAAGTALSEFDFLYLPMDFISGNNLGYAFVNFTSSASARRFYHDMHMKSWSTFGSRKVCEITHANIQGLEELVKHFRRSIFTCSSAEYLPVYFQPSRDGSRNSIEHIVGKLVQRSLDEK